LKYNIELENKFKDTKWLLVGNKFYDNFKFLNIQVINEDIKISDYKISGIINTLDNTRKYIDEECFKHNLPLFDAKIKKLSGYVFPVIPFITDTYFSSNEPEQEITFPLCVIKSFPNDIKHIIEWALQEFENISILFKNLDTLNENEKAQFDKYINLFNSKQYNELAINIFNDYFYNSIINLLETCQNKVLFWSKGKRCPKPIQYDIENEDHTNFIKVTEEFFSNFSSQIFNYENDLHVKWIHYASNLRAINYGIPTINILKTKWLSAKSYPVISTTLSCVSGFILLEMLKYLNKETNIINFKSNIIDIITTTIISSNPPKSKMIEIGGIDVNNWTKFEYNDNTTLDKFKKYYENIFETIITMIVIDTTIIYADFIESDFLNKNLLDILLNHYNTDKLPDDINFNLLSNDNKDIPSIKILINN
jgi:ubiquitin-activating enzyme E1